MTIGPNMGVVFLGLGYNNFSIMRKKNTFFAVLERTKFKTKLNFRYKL